MSGQVLLMPDHFCIICVRQCKFGNLVFTDVMSVQQQTVVISMPVMCVDPCKSECVVWCGIKCLPRFCITKFMLRFWLTDLSPLSSERLSAVQEVGQLRQVEGSLSRAARSHYVIYIMRMRSSFVYRREKGWGS